ncbi:hypothetical protein ACJX0J_018564, partial [Zea mays]
KRMNSGQMIVVQVIWKCLYMTGGMKHIWLISDDEDLDDEVDDGAEDEDLCKLALYTALGGFDPSMHIFSYIYPEFLHINKNYIIQTTEVAVKQIITQVNNPVLDL